MPAKTDPREGAADTYYYRRSLSVRELLPAIGVGVATGVLAFYVTRVMMQRTPLTPEGLALSSRRKSARALPGSRAG